MTNESLQAIAFFFTGASVKLARVRKCVLFPGCQIGVIVPGGVNEKHGHWGWELNHVLVLHEQQLQNAASGAKYSDSFICFPCVQYC